MPDLRFLASSVEEYDAGGHRVTIGRRGPSWWYVAVDGLLLPGRFPTAAAAWADGVKRADALDRNLPDAADQAATRRRVRSRRGGRSGAP